MKAAHQTVILFHADPRDPAQATESAARTLLATHSRRMTTMGAAMQATTTNGAAIGPSQPSRPMWTAVRAGISIRNDTTAQLARTRAPEIPSSCRFATARVSQNRNINPDTIIIAHQTTRIVKRISSTSASGPRIRAFTRGYTFCKGSQLGAASSTPVVTYTLPLTTISTAPPTPQRPISAPAIGRGVG